MCAPLPIREQRCGLLYVDEMNVFVVAAVQAGFAIDRAGFQSQVVNHEQGH
jgi:hypothetical protein